MAIRQKNMRKRQDSINSTGHISEFFTHNQGQNESKVMEDLDGNTFHKIDGKNKKNMMDHVREIKK